MGWRGRFVLLNSMISRFFIAVVLVSGTTVFAQPGRGRGGPGDFAVLPGEFGIENQVVQGAPYTAQAATQVTRVLADGNRIQRTTTASLARDTLGRTRVDLTMNGIGQIASAALPLHFRTVFINDPVAGASYMLDPERQTVRQMPLSIRGRGERGTARPEARSNVKNEDLGTQTIQGITAQGKRVTRTIPAGQLGNQQPIEIVTETWRSPDLQIIVMSKTSDPRFGETLYQLTNVNRAEPDHSLFTVPPDYTVRAGRPGARGR